MSEKRNGAISRTMDLGDPLLEETRQSWNVATRAHNAHKQAQGPWLRENSTLFPEELGLLGDVSGQQLLHLCCNSGQDTVSLAKHHGALCTGVDFSDEALSTARALAAEAGAEVSFQQDEAVHFVESTTARFDVVFGSYGFLPWMRDLPRLLRGIRRVLRPGGRFVVLEFHPMAWSFDEGFRLRDPYFTDQPFSEPVSDYVGNAGGALSPSGHQETVEPYHNPHRAHAFQQPTAEIVMAVLGAGLALEGLYEWPYSNGCRIHDGLVPMGAEGLPARRFTTPPGVPSLPLMLGLLARVASDGSA